METISREGYYMADNKADPFSNNHGDHCIKFPWFSTWMLVNKKSKFMKGFFSVFFLPDEKQCYCQRGLCNCNNGGKEN